MAIPPNSSGALVGDPPGEPPQQESESSPLASPAHPHVCGVVTRLHRVQEGEKEALRFVLQGDDGSKAAVELCGTEIRGVVDEGDSVELICLTDKVAADHVVRPSQIHNLATDSYVHALEVPIRQRAFRSVVVPAVTAAVGAGLTAAASLVIKMANRAAGIGAEGSGASHSPSPAVSPSQTPSPPGLQTPSVGAGPTAGAPQPTGMPSPPILGAHPSARRPPSSGLSPGFILALAVMEFVVLWVVWFCTIGRRHREQGRSVWLTTIALASGVALANLGIFWAG